MLVTNNNHYHNHHHHKRQQISSNGSFARHAARAALAPNNNITNIQVPNRKSMVASSLQNQTIDNDGDDSTEIDKIVESVTNATKRLSQISTNTNSSKRKSKNHVGPWRLGRTLGRGSTGRVRLAKHSETGQLAAVKIVPKSKFQKHGDSASTSTTTTATGADDDKDTSPYGIEREIIIMKLITHQNIMGLYDVWENKGELYLVLEYVEGGELFDYLIKKGRLPEKEAVHYFRQIVSGVSYCHQFNICHRDLKPENLLLDKNLNIKIADFGMAALELNQKLLETSCGSPHYASPEIVTGKTYHGSPSDIWSCGIILFALLTGHLPFDDENIRKLLMKVQSGRFVMPNYLSVEAKDLIWKMLKVNPNDRIKISEIMKHPLLKQYETSTTQKSNNSDRMKLENYYNEVDTLNLTKSEIDHDLLKSLSILFHGAKESSLVPKLLQPQSSPEKIFYYLLYKYKKQHHLKEKAEVTQKNSKKKLGNGDGLLKKSKSTIKTTITNQDGTTTVSVSEQPAPPPAIPSTPKNSKRIGKSPTGQLQIPVSSSYRRGVSFNNKQLNNDLSRSSSRRSLASAAVVAHSSSTNQTNLKPTSNNNISVTNMKKRQSILPPLPDLGVDWLNFGSDGTLGSDEFATLYDEIFNYKATPKGSRRPSRKSSPTKKPLSVSKQSFITSTPMELKQEEDDIGDADDEEEYALKPPSGTLEPRKSLLHTPSKPLPRQLGNFEVSNRRNVSEPMPAPSKGSTLDPKFKSRAISSNNAEILNKIGVNITRDMKTSSKIYYSKSSTSINLASILKNAGISNGSNLNKSHLSQQQQPSSNILPASSPPPLPKHRKSSSRYPSFDDVESAYADTTHDLSFDFEVPTQTEIATAIQISNGSNITVGKRVKPREDSMFEDISGIVTTPTEATVMNPSISNNSIVKRHKKAKSIEHKFFATPSMDIRGSLFNNPTDFKEDKTIPPPSSTLELSKPRYNRMPTDNIDDSINKSSFLENSFFADNTECFSDEFANAKRVTMIFDDEAMDYDNARLVDAVSDYNTSMDSPVKKDLINTSPAKPLKSSPLKSIQQKHFIQTSDGTLKKSTIDLQPQRIAPSAPSITPVTVVQQAGDSSKIKKSNWFTKFFSSLISSSSAETTNTRPLPPVQKRQNPNDVKSFKSTIPMKTLRRGIESALELKRKEGTLTALKSFGGYISATIPATFALGKPLKFEIEFQAQEVLLKRVKGSKKIFKNLIGAMEFVIDNEGRRFNEVA